MQGKEYCYINKLSQMRKIYLYVILFFLCLFTNKLQGEEYKYYKDIYVVDTIEIENPVVIQYKKFHIPLFVCSNNNLYNILNDKNFYNRDDVYILGEHFLATIFKQDALCILKNKECKMEYIDKKKSIDIFKFKESVKFLLTLVTIQKTNEMHTQFFDDCVDNSCKKEKRYYIKIKHPNNFYNRIVCPLCE